MITIDDERTCHTMTNQGEEDDTGKSFVTSPTTTHNDHPPGGGGDDDDDIDKEEEEPGDEFFGNQENADDHDHDHEEDEFGALGRHETRAHRRDVAALGYVESYDDTKEVRLQEGFEAGYRQTFDASLRVGDLFGQWMARAELLDDNNNDNDKDNQQDAIKQQSSTISRRLHEFLIAFQRGSIDPTVVQESLAALEEEMKQARIE